MSKPFNVRMDDEFRGRIEQRVVDGEAPSASAWAREALAGVDELGGLVKLREVLELIGREGRFQPHPPHAIKLSSRRVGRIVRGQCEHPADARRRTPYSVHCTRCGATIEEAAATS